METAADVGETGTPSLFLVEAFAYERNTVSGAGADVQCQARLVLGGDRDRGSTIVGVYPIRMNPSGFPFCVFMCRAWWNQVGADGTWVIVLGMRPGGTYE